MDEKEFDSVDSLSEYLHNQKGDEKTNAENSKPRTDNGPLFLLHDLDAKHRARAEEPNEHAYQPANDTASLESVNSIMASISKHKTEQLEGKAFEQAPEGATRMIDAVKSPQLHSTLDKLDTKKHGDTDATQMIDAIKDTEKAVQEHNKDILNERKRRQALRRKRDIEQLKRLKKSRLRKRTAWHIAGGVLLSVSIICISVLLAIFVIRGALDFMGLSEENYTIQVDVPADADVDDIAVLLKSNGIIAMPELFKFYAGFKDKSELGFYEGTFTLNTNMTYSGIIDALTTTVKKKETVSLFIQEGMTALEIAQLLEENHVCRAEDFIVCYKNYSGEYSFEKRLEDEPLKFDQLEGYLFPDTYEFYVINDLKEPVEYDTPEEAKKAEEKIVAAASDAAKKMYSNFNDKITVAMYKRMGELGLTLDDTITLASMVQREAGTAEDMQLVASTFLNRLADPENFPYLQSDVTILYIESNIKSQMTNVEIAQSSAIISAYNTYNSKGIPPGPICNPGIEAINAVLYAPETDYYYFCANKETGEVYYASTLAVHEQNLVLAGLSQ